MKTELFCSLQQLKVHVCLTGKICHARFKKFENNEWLKYQKADHVTLQNLFQLKTNITSLNV